MLKTLMQIIAPVPVEKQKTFFSDLPPELIERFYKELPVTDARRLVSTSSTINLLCLREQRDRENDIYDSINTLFKSIRFPSQVGSGANGQAATDVQVLSPPNLAERLSKIIDDINAVGLTGASLISKQRRIDFLLMIAEKIKQKAVSTLERTKENRAVTHAALFHMMFDALPDPIELAYIKLLHSLHQLIPEPKSILIIRTLAGLAHVLRQSVIYPMNQSDEEIAAERNRMRFVVTIMQINSLRYMSNNDVAADVNSYLYKIECFFNSKNLEQIEDLNQQNLLMPLIHQLVNLWKPPMQKIYYETFSNSPLKDTRGTRQFYLMHLLTSLKCSTQGLNKSADIELNESEMLSAKFALKVWDVLLENTRLPIVGASDQIEIVKAFIDVFESRMMIENRNSISLSHAAERGTQPLIQQMVEVSGQSFTKLINLLPELATSKPTDEPTVTQSKVLSLINDLYSFMTADQQTAVDKALQIQMESEINNSLKQLIELTQIWLIEKKISHGFDAVNHAN